MKSNTFLFIIKKRKERALVKKTIWTILFFLCAVVFCYSGWKLYQSLYSYKEADHEYREIRKITEKKEKSGIDFKKLKKINPDIIGWIYIEGTRIDYPIVQGKNNQEYLHKTVQGRKNASGSIFMDAKGKKDFNSDNNVIYGHHMRNGSMFADLMKLRENSFVKKHPYIFLYTPKYKLRLKIISAYAKPAAGAQIPIDFSSRKEKKKYMEKIQRSSEILEQTAYKRIPNHLYTFVTCSYERKDNRTFVHAVESERTYEMETTK